MTTSLAGATQNGEELSEIADRSTKLPEQRPTAHGNKVRSLVTTIGGKEPELPVSAGREAGHEVACWRCFFLRL